MHIHCLTDNNKVVSVKKIVKFQNVRNILRQPRSALPPYPVSPVSFGPPPPWIAPPRRETWLRAWLVIF